MAKMNEKQEDALRRWYAQEWILDTVKRAHEEEDWEEVESHVHRTVLLPLGKHNDLPDFMRNDVGGPLFPTNLSPLQDHEGWSEAVEIGWQVVSEKLGISRDEVQGKIRAEQDEDWEVFMKSVEERERKKKNRDA